MRFIKVNDIHIPDLNIYHQFRDNAFTADQSFVADSPKVVNLLLKSDIIIKSILATEAYYAEFMHLIEDKNIPQLFVASKELMQKIVGHKIHHNVMMHGKRPSLTSLDKLDKHIIMLDEISSTQNIGSIARSAAALGIHSYLLPTRGPHPYSRRALRVSMGHISMLKISLYNNIIETIQYLKEEGYHIYAAEVRDNATPLSSIEVAEKWVLLMGHEGSGISDEVLAHCDEVIQIEMEKGIKSFNVGIAASIIMYSLKYA